MVPAHPALLVVCHCCRASFRSCCCRCHRRQHHCCRRRCPAALLPQCLNNTAGLPPRRCMALPETVSAPEHTAAPAQQQMLGWRRDSGSRTWRSTWQQVETKPLMQWASSSGTVLPAKSGSTDSTCRLKRLMARAAATPHSLHCMSNQSAAQRTTAGPARACLPGCPDPATAGHP